MIHFFISRSIPILLLTSFLSSCTNPTPLQNEKFTSVSVKDFKGVANKSDIEVRVYSGALDTKIVVNAPTKLAEKLNVSYIGNILVIDSGDYCADIKSVGLDKKQSKPKLLTKLNPTPVQKATLSTAEAKCESLLTNEKPFIEIFGPGVTELSNFSTGGMIVEYVKADKLLVNNYGKGDMKFTNQLTLQSLEATNTSSGNISFTSKVSPIIDTTKFNIQGSGNINASDISTNSTFIALNGEGSLQINTLKEISGIVKGNGTLTLFEKIPISDIVVVGFEKIKFKSKPTTPK
jgi:Putative auto-transporter adhesin, head GIN domain